MKNGMEESPSTSYLHLKYSPGDSWMDRDGKKPRPHLVGSRPKWDWDSPFNQGEEQASPAPIEESPTLTGVDDLVVEGLDGSTFKKLSNGKFASLLCPHHCFVDTDFELNPIANFPPFVQIRYEIETHCKGSRHRAAESRLKERELARQHEMNNRIALSTDCSGGTAEWRTCNQEFENSQQDFRNKIKVLESSKNHVIACGASGHLSTNSSVPDMEVSNKVVGSQHLDYRERVERELKFTAAGWKRDCHGKWYKDENVECDSDEEDPNVCPG
ncbi:hypothetical protein FNV43_RR22455 [Rhamnella rubrinervis]|uniref:Sodium channel modifier 1 acidic C-terminal domain-containing protein n=1 Tax=Rhamnella rubrinervis TaxID=2594499 RepID=A0A8K0DRL8_9ROSA|nr:hypothetical protein FNV43_RR22455 [Rhamnella rubrinervis]